MDDKNTGFLSKWFYIILSIIIFGISAVIMFLPIMDKLNLFGGIILITMFITGILYILFGLSFFYRSKISDISIILGTIGYLGITIISYLMQLGEKKGSWGGESGGWALLPYLLIFFIFIFLAFLSLTLLIISLIKNFIMKDK